VRKVLPLPVPAGVGRVTVLPLFFPSKTQRPLHGLPCPKQRTSAPLQVRFSRFAIFVNLPSGNGLQNGGLYRVLRGRTSVNLFFISGTRRHPVTGAKTCHSERARDVRACHRAHAPAGILARGFSTPVASPRPGGFTPGGPHRRRFALRPPDRGDFIPRTHDQGAFLPPRAPDREGDFRSPSGHPSTRLTPPWTAPRGAKPAPLEPLPAPARPPSERL
jgi:hypothetical protein